MPPPSARLHPHRGYGGLYAVLAAVVFLLVLAGAGSNLADGHLVTAAVILVLGLALSALFAALAVTLLVPVLDVDLAGVRGRISWRTWVDSSWPEVTVTADDDGEPGTLRLEIGEAWTTVSSRSWSGFVDFVLLLASTPEATARLTPAARREVVRLLGLDGPAPAGPDASA